MSVQPDAASLAQAVDELRALFTLGKSQGWQPTQSFIDTAKWLADGAPAANLASLQKHLHDSARNAGSYCPCCERFTKYYRMSLSQSNCRVLLRYYAIWKLSPTRYEHITQVFKLEPGASKSRDYNRLTLFGLLEIEPNPTAAKSRGRKSGRWRLTDLGVAFVEGRTSIPQYAWTWYDSQVDPTKDRVVSFDGPSVRIDFFNGKTFDYTTHMAACLAQAGLAPPPNLTPTTAAQVPTNP
jgi:hypothetical protein